MVVKAPLPDLYGKPIQRRDHSCHIVNVGHSGCIITIAIEETPAKKAKMNKPLSSAISEEIFLDDTVVSAKEGFCGKSVIITIICVRY